MPVPTVTPFPTTDHMSRDERTVVAVQVLLRRRGWRWTEVVYNDGSVHDCQLRISQDRGTQPLFWPTELPDAALVGWGRFSRLQCWEYAGSFVLRWESIAAYIAAGRPDRRYW